MPASASLRNTAAPAPGTLPIRTVSASRSAYGIYAILERRAGRGFVVGDEGDGPRVATRGAADDDVDPAGGHRRAHPSELTRSVLELDDERAHAALSSLPGRCR